MTRKHTIVADLTSLSEKKFANYGERLFNYALPETAAAVYGSLLTAPLTTTTVHEPHPSSFSSAPYENVTFNDVEPTDLAVGDLVLAHWAETDRYSLGYSKRWQGKTLADVQGSYSGFDLYVVTKRTPAGAVVTPVRTSARHSSYGVLDVLDHEAYAERWLPSAKRTIFKTGYTLEEFTAALDAHADLPRLKDLLADAKAYQAEHDRRFEAARKAEKDAVKAARAPFKAQAKALNAAIGYDVFTYSTTACTIRAGWAEVPTEALVTLAQANGQMLSATTVAEVRG